MQRDDMMTALKELLELDSAGTTTLIDEAVALDASRFCDAERLAHERQALFLHRPQVVGMSSDLEPGGYSTQTVAGVHVLLTRDNEGQFHAFLNACRHRGTAVAQGCGKARRLVCPWHAWSYDLRGALVGVAHASTFGEIDKNVNGLIELPSAERHGMLFVTPTPGERIDVDAMLADLGPELADFNFASLHRVAERTTEVDINWKLGNDTGFELYHVAYLHKNSVGPANIGNTGLYRRYGYNHRMTAVSPAARDLIGTPEDQWEPWDHLQFIYNIFPSSGLVVANAMVALTRLDPGPVPNKSTFRFTTYSWTPLDDENAQAGAEFLNEFLYNVINNEDFVTASRTQANLDTGLLDRVLVGRNEPAITMAHRAYDTVLAG
ncbi:aromatic ring-hydroxylating dioxygenase subunit alpha [Mycobacterium sp. UM_CSW]|uniref:aromatic ring-hydroxylating oxygenase subunit alpha n=1 Tax=Mycobacterium sp. UM_CSW TaxID=1370119 RepID=UPI0004100770|nr:aromatic ring-hydroxylating dioxygenase subunit alpha [Mycobacterium sp. UM_CSW]